jgi:hypothetical protein
MEGTQQTLAIHLARLSTGMQVPQCFLAFMRNNFFIDLIDDITKVLSRSYRGRYEVLSTSFVLCLGFFCLFNTYELSSLKDNSKLSRSESLGSHGSTKQMVLHPIIETIVFSKIVVCDSTCIIITMPS